MKTNIPLPSGDTAATPCARSMNRKPVYTVAAKTIINPKSQFVHKQLCTGPAFSPGDRCVYQCAYCFVAKSRCAPPVRAAIGEARQHGLAEHQIVVRRHDPVATARANLENGRGGVRPFARQPGVIFASPLVDVAANVELAQETAAIIEVIHDLTPWDVRLLSKSNLLPKIAGLIPADRRHRVIYGVSTGTLDDDLAKSFEVGTALVSQRLASVHELQDRGLRTYGMICPSLPLGTEREYVEFAREMAAALRVDRMEQIWAEVINVRGESMERTVGALRSCGFAEEADRLVAVSGPGSRKRWDAYAHATFDAHRRFIGPEKLRFLQYVKKDNRDGWQKEVQSGAVLLGKAAADV